MGMAKKAHPCGVAAKRITGLSGVREIGTKAGVNYGFMAGL